MLESVRKGIWKRRNGNWGTHGRIGMRRVKYVFE